MDRLRRTGKAIEQGEGGFDDSDNLEQLEQYVREQLDQVEEKFALKLST